MTNPWLHIPLAEEQVRDSAGGRQFHLATFRVPRQRGRPHS